MTPRPCVICGEVFAPPYAKRNNKTCSYSCASLLHRQNSLRQWSIRRRKMDAEILTPIDAARLTTIRQLYGWTRAHIAEALTVIVGQPVSEHQVWGIEHRKMPKVPGLIAEYTKVIESLSPCEMREFEGGPEINTNYPSPRAKRRVALGISQDALAKRLGYSSSVLWSWESGRKVPTPEQYKMWDQALASFERKAA